MRSCWRSDGGITTGKTDSEWNTYSDARKQEEVRYRGDRVNACLLGGIQWLTLFVLFFLALAALTPPLPAGQTALVQWATVWFLIIGIVAVTAMILSSRDYRRFLNRL